jgi:hypothetical protein
MAYRVLHGLVSLPTGPVFQGQVIDELVLGDAVQRLVELGAIEQADGVAIIEQADPGDETSGPATGGDQADALAELEALTVDELTEMAKKHGISPLPKKKAELIAAIEGVQ